MRGHVVFEIPKPCCVRVPHALKLLDYHCATLFVGGACNAITASQDFFSSALNPIENVPPSLAPIARRPASGGTVAEHYLLRSRRAGGKQLRRCEKRCGSEVKCFYLTWVAHPSDQVCRIKQVELSGVLSACSPRNHVAPHVAKEVVSSAASKVSNRQPQAAVTYTVDG